jgi:hypothetical protein
MTYSTGLRATRIQAKRKKRQKLTIFVASLAAIVLFAWLFFQLGQYNLESNQASLRSENEKAIQELNDTTKKIESLEQLIEKAKAETKTWSERYQRDVPQGAGKDLYEIMRQKMEEGISVDRLSFVIRNTQPTSKCSEKPIIKKILLKAGGKSNINDKTSFFDDQLIFQGEGKPHKNPDGSLEFWFDPQAPISVTLTHMTGKSHVANGVLPFQTNFIVGNHNYLFNIRSGPRGYVHVSGTLCDYP